MNAGDFVASTCDPAFAVDLDGLILGWNEAAEEALGYRGSEVLGHKCWQVVRGRDIYGNRYCNEHCPLRDHAFRGEPWHRARMSVRTAAGDRLQMNDGCMVVRGASSARTRLIHILRPVEGLTPAAGGVRPAPEDDAASPRVSKRQLQILRLLADGKDTADISQQLGIRVSTTRNHIQAIFSRLKVHSRLEAVAIAGRLGLV